MGYNGITQSYIYEVDFVYDKEYDTAANTFSIKDCINGTCTPGTPGTEKTFTPVFTGKTFYQADIKVVAGKSYNLIYSF